MAIAREWDGATYDRVSAPMEAMGREVLARLELSGDETVVDAGCGSGRMTAALLERLPRGRVIGVDGAPSMIEAGARAPRRARRTSSSRRRPLRARPRRRARRRDPLDGDLPLDQGPRRRCSRACAPRCATAAGSSRSAAGAATSRVVREAGEAVSALEPFAEYLGDWPGPWRYAAPEETEELLRARRLRVGALLAPGAAGRDRRPARPTTATSSWARTSASSPTSCTSRSSTPSSRGSSDPARDPVRAAEHRRRRLTRRLAAAEQRRDLHLQRRPAHAPVGGREQAPRRPRAVPLLGLAPDQREQLGGSARSSRSARRTAARRQRVVVGEADRAPVAVLESRAARAARRPRTRLRSPRRTSRGGARRCARPRGSRGSRTAASPVGADQLDLKIALLAERRSRPSASTAGLRR